MYIRQDSVKDEEQFEEQAQSLVEDLNTIGIKFRPYIVNLSVADYEELTRENQNEIIKNAIEVYEGNR